MSYIILLLHYTTEYFKCLVSKGYDMAERVITILKDDEVLEKLRMLREENVNISEILHEAILKYKLAKNATILQTS